MKQQRELATIRELALELSVESLMSSVLPLEPWQKYSAVPTGLPKSIAEVMYESGAFRLSAGEFVVPTDNRKLVNVCEMSP
jgi:hypothetical protein